MQKCNHEQFNLFKIRLDNLYSNVNSPQTTTDDMKKELFEINTKNRTK